jgi:hypothetical protein
LKILFTNNTLATRAGTELWVRDVAVALQTRGHEVSAYSPFLGDVAEDLRGGGVRVVDDLAALVEPPDLIHGHHHLEAMTALFRFPGVPAVFVCHAARAWEEDPPLFPRIRRYVAVDAPCHERLLAAGIGEDMIRVLPNFVDLGRFRARPPLPVRPRRALVFGNSLGASSGLAEIRSACGAAGLEVDVLGIAGGAVSARPEDVLGRYDLVFAKARAAMEAMATGCAVVLCDAGGVGPMVRFAELGKLRALNFGFRTLQDPLTEGVLGERIRRYDPADAGRVSAWIRGNAGLNAAVGTLARIHAEALEDVPASRLEAEMQAAAQYLKTLSMHVKFHDMLLQDRDRLARELEAASRRPVLR